MINYFKYLIIIFIFAGILAPALSASADGFVPCYGIDKGDQHACTVCDIFELISLIYGYIVKIIMPILAGLLFLWGGIMMVFAGASEESYKKGKAIFVNTAIGVIIVLISWIAINTILVEFARSSPGFQTGSWWQGVTCK